MQGFFTKKETQSVSFTKGKIHSCASCGLHKNCKTPKMKPYGNFEKGIICLGEAPDEIDDERGKPWQGKDGRLLKKTLRQYGIDLFQDCLSLNAVNCTTPDDRKPTSNEIDHCRFVLVWKTLMEYQPKLILLFGSAALDSVIGHRWKARSQDESLTKWRGWVIPDQDLKAWVCPVYHPNYIQRTGDRKEVKTIWNQDIKNALDHVEKPFPTHKSPDIEIVKDTRFLNGNNGDLFAFDYETTGKKPHMKGHRIISCAIANTPDHVWAFMMPKTKEGKKPLRKWLRNNNIRKIAQNLKFEHSWGKNRLKVVTRGWEWDTMLASHLLDNRTGVTGLKFQVYVQFGIIDYNSEVDNYLQSVDKEHGANTMNSILELVKTEDGRKKLLEYNALDAVFEYKLALLQMEQLDWDFLPF